MTAAPRTVRILQAALRTNPSPEVQAARAEYDAARQHFDAAEERLDAALDALMAAVVAQAGIQPGDVLTAEDGQTAVVKSVSSVGDVLTVYQTSANRRTSDFDPKWRRAIITRPDKA